MFGYLDLLAELDGLKRLGVEVGSIGTSTLGQNIPYVFVGQKNGNYMIAQASMHAREHITALLCLCQAKHLLTNQLNMLGGIYFVPMANPDGVRLCQEGVGWIDDKVTKTNLVAINGGKHDFSLWKANANGVDINVNFDADWGKGKQNVYCKAGQNYVGKSACSEKETLALVDFTQKVSPLVTLSYHCKGEVVYWYFGQTRHRKWRDNRYAKAIAQHTGYALVDDTAGSVGGYKDWCIQSLRIPAYTIEVGCDDFEHPFPYSQFEKILQQNLDLPRKLLNSVVCDYNKLKKSNLLYAMDLD